MTETVKLGYSSSENATFRGEADTGYTLAEWNSLTPEERQLAHRDALNELVDLFVITEGAASVF